MLTIAEGLSSTLLMYCKKTSRFIQHLDENDEPNLFSQFSACMTLLAIFQTKFKYVLYRYVCDKKITITIFHIMRRKAFSTMTNKAEKFKITKK